MPPPEDFITRKEYEERHTAMQLQLAKVIGIMEANQNQITEMTKQLSDVRDKFDNLKELVAKVERQVAVASTYNKFLWPIVTITCTVVGVLAGMHI